MYKHAASAPKEHAGGGSKVTPDFRAYRGTDYEGMFSELHGTIGNRAVGNLVERTLAATGPTIRRMTDEDREGKPNKQKYQNSLKKYNAGAQKLPGNAFIESFDYLFGKAEDYNDLTSLIDAEFDKAEKQRLAAEAQKNKLKEEKEKEAQAPQPLPQMNDPATTSTPAEAPKKKKKKQIDITKDIISSGSTTKQEKITDSKKATNLQLQQWIKNKPATASIERTGMEVKEETVYIYATVKIPDKDAPAIIDEYPIEVHYHPVEISKNFLHVKHGAGSSPKNQVGANSWLIPGGKATLKEAVQDWNVAHPDNESKHKWT